MLLVVREENECRDCATPAYPCMGDSCRFRHVKHYYCDECGYFECPACGDLIYAEGARFEEHRYCLSCGQKLDWSD